MKTARAYSGGVVLPDGRLWVTGGLDGNSILKTTEILEETSSGIWKTHRGPDLPKPLFGHCIEMLRNGNVLLSGGFNGDDQDDITEEFEWIDDLSGKWSTKDWSSAKHKRYDHSCFSKGGMVEVVGGWNADVSEKLKTERYNKTSRKWEELENENEYNEMDSALPYVLRSATIGVSEGNVALIGGVRCQLDDASSGKKTCEKHKEVYELDMNVSLNRMEWKKTSKKIGRARSSHASINVPKSIAFSCNSATTKR